MAARLADASRVTGRAARKICIGRERLACDQQAVAPLAAAAKQGAALIDIGHFAMNQRVAESTRGQACSLVYVSRLLAIKLRSGPTRPA